MMTGRSERGMMRTMEIMTTFPTLEALRAPQPSLRAILFDMDGTLFQTEEIHGEVLREMAQDWKLRPPFPPSEVEARLKGMSDAQVVELARSWEGFPLTLSVEDFIQEKNQRLQRLIPRIPVQQWCSSELVKLLHDSRAQGLATAVVTSSERVVTDLLLKTAHLTSLFDTVITLQDVRHAKPHPWPYLQAMLQLGVGPRETVIFEDSTPGLASARASGARAIQVDWWSGLAIHPPG